MLGAFCRLTAGNADALIAFFRPDPCPIDSENKTVLRRLSNRRPSRSDTLLFDATMSDSATKAWKGCHDRELAKGLPRTASLNVLERNWRGLRSACSNK